MSVLIRTIRCCYSNLGSFGNRRSYVAESFTKSPFESNISRILRNEMEYLADTAPPLQPYEKKLLNTPMRDIKVQKLVLNISVGGESRVRLIGAAMVLQYLSGQTPVFSKARHTDRSFGNKRNEKITCYVTVRGDKVMQVLGSGLKVKKYELLRRNFSDTGCFRFGIQDHIEMGFKYDPSICVYGMNFFVVLERPGNRVGRSPHCKARVGIQHRVTKDDAMKWFQAKYEGVILNKSDEFNPYLSMSSRFY